MIQARRLDQGASAEQPPLGPLDVAPGRLDGAGQHRMQPAPDLAVDGLEAVDGARRPQAQSQPRLRVLDEQADGGVPARAAGAAQAVQDRSSRRGGGPLQSLQQVAPRLQQVQRLVLHRIPVGRRPARPRQGRRGLGRRRRDQGRQAGDRVPVQFGAGGRQQAVQAQRDGARRFALQVRGQNRQPGQVRDHGLGRLAAQLDRRAQVQQNRDAGRGQGLGVARVEGHDQAAVQRRAGRRQRFRRARRDPRPVGQGDHRRGLGPRLQKQGGPFAVGGAQDVRVGGAASPRQARRPRQRRVPLRVRAVAAGAFAAVHRVGHGVQRLGQCLGRLDAQTRRRAGRPRLVQHRLRGGVGQVGRRGRRARVGRRDQAQTDRPRQAGGEGLGVGGFGEHASVAPPGGQALGPGVDHAVQPAALPLDRRPVQPRLDLGVGPAGGRFDLAQGAAALDDAGLHRDSVGQGGEVGLNAHAASPREAFRANYGECDGDPIYVVV